jgi:hypothetical protein
MAKSAQFFDFFLQCIGMVDQHRETLRTNVNYRIPELQNHERNLGF